MYPVIDDSPHFHRLLAGRADADMAAVAFEIARDAYPGLDDARGHAGLDELARRTEARLPAAPERWLVLTAMHSVLFEEYGFHGNESDYYDPRNSYLSDVLTRRTGIPISLSLLYILVAERLGVPVAGVNLPGHFVVRVEIEGEPCFFDPYRAGSMVDRAAMNRLVERALRQRTRLSPAQLEACSPLDIVARMLQNLKLIYIRRRRFEDAIPVLKRLALVHRDAPEELRDLGILCFYEHRRRESLEYLREYLRAAPGAEDADEIRLLLRSAETST